MEEKVICPYCFGLRCGFSSEEHRSFTYKPVGPNICGGYSLEELQIDNINCAKSCRAICPMCRGIGMVDWVDLLFYDQDEVTAYITHNDFIDLKLNIIKNVNNKNYWIFEGKKFDINQLIIRNRWTISSI